MGCYNAQSVWYFKPNTSETCLYISETYNILVKDSIKETFNKKLACLRYFLFGTRIKETESERGPKARAQWMPDCLGEDVGGAVRPSS